MLTGKDVTVLPNFKDEVAGFFYGPAQNGNFAINFETKKTVSYAYDLSDKNFALV